MAYQEDRLHKRQNKRFWIVFVVVTLFIATAAGLYLRPKAAPPAAAQPVVPPAVSDKVSFPVYYPDPKKLPNGYTLDRNSFNNPVKNGVDYSVSYDGDKKLVFSVQAKPSDAQLQTFNSSYIPLRVDYQTPTGQAEIGAYHSQTLVSLPIANGPWIVITAPADINQNQLKTVLSNMRH